MTLHAQQTNYHFSHTITTSATTTQIWQIWTDVPNWKVWDTGLRDAKLNGIFMNGAKGKIQPDKGPKSTFIIENVQENKSYLLKTRIPFGWLIIHRSMEMKGGKLNFTHEVQFTGILKKIIGNKIGKRYRHLLPSVMENIKAIAESNHSTL